MTEFYSTQKIEQMVNRVFYHCGLKYDNNRAKDYANEIAQLIEINDDVAVKIKNYVVKEFKGFNYPSLKLFLNGAGGVDKAEKYAELAWESLQDRLPYMKPATSYYSNDKFLLTAIDRIGINYIKSKQEVVDVRTNRLNPFAEKELKKRFIAYYKDAYEHGNVIKEIKGKGVVKNKIKGNYALPEKAVEINKIISAENKLLLAEINETSEEQIARLTDISEEKYPNPIGKEPTLHWSSSWLDGESRARLKSLLFNKGVIAKENSYNEGRGMNENLEGMRRVSFLTTISMMKEMNLSRFFRQEHDFLK